jgi:hypothetical protein
MLDLLCAVFVDLRSPASLACVLNRAEVDTSSQRNRGQETLWEVSAGLGRRTPLLAVAAHFQHLSLEMGLSRW